MMHYFNVLVEDRQPRMKPIIADNDQVTVESGDCEKRHQCIGDKVILDNTY